MYWELIVEEYQRIKKPYWITFALLLGYVLLNPRPHTTFDILLIFLSSIHGGTVGEKLFNPATANPFLFTLPLSRSKLFLLQFATGFFLILTSLLASFIVIATGLRCGVQLTFRSIYFPAVQWYELWAILAIALFIFFGYTVSSFLFVNIHFNRSFSKKRKLCKEDILALKALTGLPLGVSIACFSWLILKMPIHVIQWDWLNTALLISFALLSIASLAITPFVYRYVEVESQEKADETYIT